MAAGPEVEWRQRSLEWRGMHMKMRFGPSGVHFFDRASGLNLLIDEIIVPETDWRGLRLDFQSRSCK
jgi:hypothetical protein